MRRALALAALVIAGCTGELGDPHEPALGPGRSPMRRLTRFEYDNAVRDLLGDTTRPARRFEPDTEVLGFDNQTLGDGVGAVRAEQYMRAAEALAATAVGRLDALLPCDPSADQAACAKAFIAAFGRRAFRRPLESDERERLFELFAAEPAAPFPDRVARVIEAVLQSPWFLYRVELTPGTSGDAPVALDGFQIAARLSFLLWGSIPDDALLEIAERDALDTPERVAKQARRMLKDPRAREAVAHFHEQWLGLGALDGLAKDPVAFPDYNAQLGPAWKEETLRFMEDAAFGEGGLRAMLTSPTTRVNGRLAVFYGISSIDPEAEDFLPVALDPARASGFLTHASVMAVYAKPTETSPILRGKFVRERLLCQPLAPPPDGVTTALPPASPGVTIRERSEAHRADPACAGCHRLMDPIGFGFEHFDAIGRWRDADQGFPVDARGEVSVTFDSDGAFDGVVALGARLADSEEVRRCVVRQWFTYGFGRPQELADRHVVEELEGAFATGDVRELIVALTASDAFRYRRP